MLYNNNITTPPKMIQFWVTVFLLVSTTTSAAAYTGEFRRRDMAGLWRLSGVDSTLLQNRVVNSKQPSYSYPLKEFTTYPKKRKSRRSPPPSETTTSSSQGNQINKEVLIMLSEDGKFKQYGDDEDLLMEGGGGGGGGGGNEEKEQDNLEMASSTSFHQNQKLLEQELQKHVAFQKSGLRILQGTWDYVDGKLILAADRPTKDERDEDEKHDTILVGKVVAVSEESLQDNPAIVSLQENEEEKEEEQDTPPTLHKDMGTPKNKSLQKHNEGTDCPIMDTHFSVPEGKVEIGKFFYPKNHPSFFEHPIFSPTSKGSFSLKQVLGNLNTAQHADPDVVVEKFKREDFLTKKFILTSYPMPKHQPKGELRWSIKYNKFVRDPPKNNAAASGNNQEEEETPMPLRVMEVAFFANHTFTTLGGLGEMVLRGKWDVIGQQKDQFWMQVWRFGFGRSAPGSTYSEGLGLSHTDEKAYWGSIAYEQVETTNNKQEKDGENSMTANLDSSSSSTSSGDVNEGTDEEESRIEVRGSVLDGWGLEPEPVAKFIMREITEAELYEDEDEDDEDEDTDVTYLEDDDAEPDGLLDWSDSFQ